MIVEMKKISLVMIESGLEKSLKTLRNHGLMHLEKEEINHEELSVLDEQLDTLQKALALLQNSSSDKSSIYTTLDEALETAKNILGIEVKVKENHSQLDLLVKEAERLIPWGVFDPADIRTLAAKGINIHLYECRKNELELIPDQYRSFIISQSKNLTLTAVISDEDVEIPVLDEFILPEMGVDEINNSIEILHKEQSLLKKELETLSTRHASLTTAVKTVSKDREFKEIYETAVVPSAEDLTDYDKGFKSSPKFPSADEYYDPSDPYIEFSN